MTQTLSEADRFLLDQVRRGDDEGWSQLVARYRGRLLAFAKAKVARRADPEDLVQDTFVNFLTGLPSFRGAASLETYLFTILRRRIIDVLRVPRLNVCQLNTETGSSDGGSERIASLSPTASWYVRRDEEYRLHSDALGTALGELVEGFRASLHFQNLQVAEAVFYAQLRNKEAAELTGVAEGQIGLKKHRWLKQVRERVDAYLRERSIGSGSGAAMWESPEQVSGMLGEVWEHHRFSCPKRSTIGHHLLGTLDEPWQRYVHFHLEKLRCGFCIANLDDIQQQQAPNLPAPPLQARIMQSTVGFFKQPGRPARG